MKARALIKQQLKASYQGKPLSYLRTLHKMNVLTLSKYNTFNVTSKPVKFVKPGWRCCENILMCLDEWYILANIQSVCHYIFHRGWWVEQKTFVCKPLNVWMHVSKMENNYFVFRLTCKPRLMLPGSSDMARGIKKWWGWIVKENISIKQWLFFVDLPWLCVRVST